MKCQTCKGTGVVVENKRTNTQNSALHKWFVLKSDQCQDAGVTPQLVFANTMEVEMSETFMKGIWKTVLKARYNKDSTTKHSKAGDEIEDMVNHLNRFFAKPELHNLEAILFPSVCGNCKNIDCLC